MKILSQDGRELVNFEKFYAIVARGKSVGAIYECGTTSIFELGYYQTPERAAEVVEEIGTAAIMRNQCYKMPGE